MAPSPHCNDIKDNSNHDQMDFENAILLHPPLSPHYTQNQASLAIDVESEVFGDSSTDSKPQHPMECLHDENSAGSITKKIKEEKKRIAHCIDSKIYRDHMKSGLQTLKMLIPELKAKKHANITTILDKGTEYIKAMEMERKNQDDMYEREKKRETQLLQRLAELKAHFDATSSP